MKVIFFNTYNKSFLSSFFLNLAIQLIERGYEVKIVSLKENPNLLQVTPKLTIQILKKRSKWLNYISIFNFIKSEKPDVIISNFSYVNPAILSGKLLGVKKNVVWFHTLTQQLNPRKSQVFIKSLFLKCASEIIVNSEYLKEDLEDQYGISKDKIFPIPFWSSIDVYNSNKEQFIDGSVFKIGCPGRIERVKNQELIIDSVLGLKTDTFWNLYFAGRGSGEQSLMSKIKKNDLENKIHLLGVLSIEEMKQYYEEMDLIILPSKFEAFGLVFIEALSMGCPVLVSAKFGALTYIKDQGFLNKYTFDPNDSIDLGSKLNNIITNEMDSPDYFKKIYSTYFQKEKIIAKVEQVINL